MNTKWTALTAPALLTLAVGTVQAEFVGVNIGASHWVPALTGSFSSSDNGSIDLVDDLNIDDPSQSSMVFILEHPIAVLPNIRYQGFDLDTRGRSTLSSDINFNGETFSSGNQVTSSFDLSHDDIVLYYELMDNWIDLDLGVDLKRFDGEVSLSGTTETSVDVEETIPLLYLAAKFDLPFNGLYLGAKLNTNIIDLGLSDSSAHDSTIMLGYETRNGLGVEGGYKYFSLDLDDVNNLDTNFEYDGIYFNGYYNF